MAFIVQPFIGDQRIQLGSEEFIRPFNWGNNWKSIRIGMRMTINDWWGTNIFSQLVIGVCDGRNGNLGYYSPYTTDWCGVVYGLPSNQNRVSAGYYATWESSQQYTGRKVGSVETTVISGASMGGFAFSSSLAQGPSMMLLTMTRSGVNNATVAFTDATTSTGTVTSRSTYLLNMEGGTTGIGSFVALKNISFAGPYYDSVSIGWYNSAPTLELSDITVLRVA